MYQKEPLTILTPSSNFIGPNVTSKVSMFEQSTSISGVVSCGLTWSGTIDWIFIIEAVATITKRVSLYVYNRVTGIYVYRGFITFTRPVGIGAGGAANRGLSVAYYTHTTGTVGVSGTTVTGNGTLFVTQRIAAGARIGFGTTDPTSVTTWYYIQSINSNTSITLTFNVISTINVGTSYVIEELRVILLDAVLTPSANSPLSGLFIAKGVNFDDFSLGGTTIAASNGTIDNLKLCYQLTDSYRTGGTFSQAGTVSNQNPQSANLDGPRKTDFDGLTHSLYVIDNSQLFSTNFRLYVYNVRANDTITSGLMALTSSNVQITGPVTLTGAVTTTTTIGNIACIATTKHGPGAGMKSLYFCTPTRFYRVDLTNIYHGKPNWISNVRTEIPPGTTTTVPISANMWAISYDESSDRFIVHTIAVNTGFKFHYTRFGEQTTDRFDYPLGLHLNYADGSTSDPRSIPIVGNFTATHAWIAMISLNGLTHVVKWGQNFLGQTNIFAIPYASHWEFANTTNEVAISPVINLSNLDEFIRISIMDLTYLGLDPYVTTINRLRTYCRTTGIDNNTGGWEPIDDSGDLSNIDPSNQIQFKFEFQILGMNFNIPPRFFGFNLIYKELVTDEHYQLSVGSSDEQTKRFVWRFASSFGATVSPLRVRLYDNYTDSLLVDDNTSNPIGTFQRSTDNGFSWATYNSQDKTNETTYIRYKPLRLSDTVDVRPILTLL
jgi:hypothetical protein